MKKRTHPANEAYTERTTLQSMHTKFNWLINFIIRPIDSSAVPMHPDIPKICLLSDSSLVLIDNINKQMKLLKLMLEVDKQSSKLDYCKERLAYLKDPANVQWDTEDDIRRDLRLFEATKLRATLKLVELDIEYSAKYK